MTIPGLEFIALINALFPVVYIEEYSAIFTMCFLDSFKLLNA